MKRFLPIAGILAIAVAPMPGRNADTTTTEFVSTPSAARVVTREASYLRPPENRATGLRSMPFAQPTTVTEIIPFDETKMMRTRDLRPGMKGYGLTVFTGIKPERFEAEFVGVRHGAFPADDMILCRLDSPYLKDIGVIAGMSGSPVFMEDKLIGAVAYGWGFTDEPLAGVTPIEGMIGVFNSTSNDLREPESASDATGYSAYQAFWEIRRRHSLDALQRLPGAQPVEVRSSDLTPEMRERFRVPESFQMQPLATPLFVSSSNPRTLRLLETLFGGFGVEPISMASAISGGTTESAQAENSPGGPVRDIQALANEMSGGYGLAVPFVEGDLSLAGVGTVTYRQGNKLVAFGHPMWEEGLVSYPMAPARVNALVRSNMRPFKLGESLGQVGTIRQDRLPAIGGVFGELPLMFNVRSTVIDPAYHGPRRYKFSIWNDKFMGPMFAMMVLQDSITGGARGFGETAALFSYTLDFDDGTSLTKEDYMVGEYSGMEPSMSVMSDLGILMTNPYKRVLPRNVDFQIQISDRFPQAEILSADLDQPVYRQGSTVKVSWKIQPYRQPAEVRNHTFVLPDNIPDGEYRVTVCDAGYRSSLESSRNPGGEQVLDFESLLRVMRRNYPRNKVYVVMQDRDTGVSVRGSELPKLPASIIETINSTVEEPYVAPVGGNVLLDAEYATNYEIRGSQRMELRVRRRNL